MLLSVAKALNWTRLMLVRPGFAQFGKSYTGVCVSALKVLCSSTWTTGPLALKRSTTKWVRVSSWGGLTLAEAQVALEERGVVVPGTNYIGYRTAWHRSGKIVKVEPSSGNSKNTTEVSK